MKGRAIAGGLLAGLAGVAAVAVADRVGRSLRRRTSEGDRETPRPRTEPALRWGRGALLGAARGVMAERGTRGTAGSLALLGLDLMAGRALPDGGVDGIGSARRVHRNALGARGGAATDLLREGLYAFVTGAVADRLIGGSPARTPSLGPAAGRPSGREAGRASRREAGRASGRERPGVPRAARGTDRLLPRAKLPDAMAAIAQVLLPTFGKGLIIRRPPAVAAAEALELDRRAVRRMQRLRERYGAGPLLVRNPLRPHRHMALLLSPEHVHRVLQETPEPFSTATAEKRGALAHFQPRLSLISHGAERAERAHFNENALEADRHAHHLAGPFLRVLDQEAAELAADVARRGELVWDDFFAAWFRMVRRVVFGAGARNDEELTDMIVRLRRRANWSFLLPQNRRLRRRFLGRVRRHLERAEPDSLAGVIARMPITPATAPAHQVPQWLFAFDPAAMATYRALALLAAHPEQADRAREEIRRAGERGRHHLPFLRACVLESLRLWPTTPLVLRETTRETRWERGGMPARTHVVSFAPYFHRDDERLTYADRFAPEVWLQDGGTYGGDENGDGKTLDDLSPADWPLIPFSAGPGMCPGRHVVLLLASNMLAALLDDEHVRLEPPGRLDPRRPLPGTLDNYRLRFRFGA